MSFTRLKLTTFGRNLEAKAKQGKGLHLTRVALGDGLLENSSMVNRTALVSEKLSLKIDAVLVTNDGHQNAVIATLDNRKMTEGFLYRELAIMGCDPDSNQEGVYLYDNAGQECEFLDLPENGVIICEHMRLLIRTEEIDKITFDYSGNPVYLSAEDLEAHNADPKAHGGLKEEILAGLTQYIPVSEKGTDGGVAVLRGIRTRVRDPGKPDYGLGGGGETAEVSVVLLTGDHTGEAEVSALVNGQEYDIENMSTESGSAPNGTLILTNMEEF